MRTHLGKSQRRVPRKNSPRIRRLKTLCRCFRRPPTPRAGCFAKRPSATARGAGRTAGTDADRVSASRITTTWNITRSRSTLGLSLGNVENVHSPRKIALAHKDREREERSTGNGGLGANVHCSSCEPLLDRYFEGTLSPRRMRRSASTAKCTHCEALLDEVNVIDALLETTQRPDCAELHASP